MKSGFALASRYKQNLMTKKHPDHIDKHEEWQDHQFDPRYFTGGKIPGWLHSTAKSKLLGSVFILAGLVYFGLIIFDILNITETGTTEAIISTIGLIFISIILLLAGIKLLRKK